MSDPLHATATELEAGLARVLDSPRDGGELAFVVRRPAFDAREELDEAELSPAEGVVGDTWSSRPSTRTSDGSPHPGRQLTLMNVRAAELLARGRTRVALAGDQLFVDLDLSEDNLPPGTRLAVGDALLEVTDQAHTGCAKFAARFGQPALAFISAPERKALRLRGIYARVVRAGRVRRGDALRKLA
ncbi:MAG: MOSC domain-containing protein [Planctomycetes bacterium]|nr:MOSC domain-containing protein [Planctomycetota bacterium]